MRECFSSVISIFINDYKSLGRRQVVTARGFDLRIPGSNPGVPANS